ncbi:hypothetical protein F3Y22_tig00111388pilonHSYRG00178 [Hibiscus syriacus]|uniref:Reverse transcriptase domain-containing protein n=1 Tax=Hibiscus syriacus TaxID=106335 RepID=A0A6A2YMB4_HIBSY|nr:hypothetical protein F3Y22_tig00111388pilonHSYRG00178 [Hibiscus syriacus]
MNITNLVQITGTENSPHRTRTGVNEVVQARGKTTTKLIALKGMATDVSKETWCLCRGTVTPAPAAAAATLNHLGGRNYNAGVYRELWFTFADSLVSIVNSALNTASFPVELNHTLIALFPKVSPPDSVKHLLPISLCTVTYKLITKVLVNRLRPLLEDLVNPLQASFISGRQATNNILLAREMVHGIKRFKGKNGLVAMKIDLEKAYDRVGLIFYCFVFNVLNFLCFGMAKKPSSLVLSGVSVKVI